MKTRIRITLAALLVAATLPAAAGKLYKCIEAGKTVYQDVSCQGDIHGGATIAAPKPIDPVAQYEAEVRAIKDRQYLREKERELDADFRRRQYEAARYDMQVQHAERMSNLNQVKANRCSRLNEDWQKAERRYRSDRKDYVKRHAESMRDLWQSSCQ